MDIRLPKIFLESLENVVGFHKDSFVEAHQTQPPTISIRFNPFKKSDWSKLSFPLGSKVLWSSQGYYLEERPSFTSDPYLHAGAYYVQEPSSMVIEEVMKQHANLNGPLRVLDLCAAPGGKSTLLHSLLSEDSLLVSNEVIKSRVEVLKENIIKWGVCNVIVTNNDPSDFSTLPDYFDVVMVDAPCSGSGLFRKDPHSVNEWSPTNVQLCHRRQQRILSDIQQALKPGGLLIYSTCSFSKEENEDIAAIMVQQFGFESLPLDLKSDWQIIETITHSGSVYGYRFYPDKTKGEGFFISAFRKKNNQNIVNSFLSNKQKTNKKNNELHRVSAATFNKWIYNHHKFSYFLWKSEAIAVPSSLEEDLHLIRSSLYVRKAGVNLGKMIRDELIPSHELALSGLMKDDFPAVVLDKERALQYLRMEPPDISVQDLGWLLVKYGTLPLGFIKSIKGRINNYYPREYRILNK